jgi:hypothetical protein
MPDNTFSRRRFGALAAGAGLAAAAVPFLTGGSASAAIGKYHGPLLTAGWEEFKTAVAQGRHNLTKVVATWGAPWDNPDFQLALANLTPYTIVRTGTGDTDNVLDAGAVVNEIRPFYQWSTQVRPADRLIIELGNEPNLHHGADFIQPYADSLHAAIDAVQANFPGVQICSPGIAPGGTSSYHDWFWNQRYKDAVNRCNFVGFHFYGAGEFDPVVYDIVGALTGHFPDKLWIATEYGLNDAYGGDPTGEKQAKCRKYSDMIHRNSHPDIQNRLWGATYFHIDTQSPDPLFQAYNVAPDGPLGYQA